MIPISEWRTQKSCCKDSVLTVEKKECKKNCCKDSILTVEKEECKNLLSWFHSHSGEECKKIADMTPFSQWRRRLQNCCQHDSSILHTGEAECKIATILTNSNLTVKKKIARIAAMKIPCLIQKWGQIAKSLPWKQFQSHSEKESKIELAVMVCRSDQSTRAGYENITHTIEAAAGSDTGGD